MNCKLPKYLKQGLAHVCKQSLNKRNLIGIYCVLDAIHALSNLHFTTSLGDKYKQSHLTDEEIDAQSVFLRQGQPRSE